MSIPTRPGLITPVLALGLASVGCASGVDPGNTGGGTDSITSAGTSDATTSGSGSSTTSGSTGGTTDASATGTSAGTTDMTTIGSTGTATCELDMAWDFAACDEGFSVGKAHVSSSDSTWECGDPSAFALGPGTDHMGVWATNLAGYYNEDESSYVASPSFSLEECAGASVTLTLEHWYNFEGGATNADGGIVQATNDGGQLWQTVASVTEGYYQSQPITATYSPVNGTKGFSALEGNKTWRTSTFDLSPWAGEAEVSLRFVIGTDAANPRGGWYIDSVGLSSP